MDIPGLVNCRDLGGLPADGGKVRVGQLWRSDNLQDLDRDAIDTLTGWGLTDIVDLRSAPELRLEGPALIHADPRVQTHYFSLLADPNADQVRPDVLPWQDFDPADDGAGDPLIGHYLSYLDAVPGSMVGALRAIAAASGAALVHCAAGKDRTGVVVALALSLVGVPRAAVVADYVRSTERTAAIINRLMSRPHYAVSLTGRSLSSHHCRASVMTGVLDQIDRQAGSLRSYLREQGWTSDDDAALRAKLVS